MEPWLQTGEDLSSKKTKNLSIAKCREHHQCLVAQWRTASRHATCTQCHSCKMECFGQQADASLRVGVAKPARGLVLFCVVMWSSHDVSVSVSRHCTSPTASLTSRIRQASPRNQRRRLRGRILVRRATDSADRGKQTVSQPNELRQERTRRDWCIWQNKNWHHNIADHVLCAFTVAEIRGVTVWDKKSAWGAKMNLFHWDSQLEGHAAMTQTTPDQLAACVCRRVQRQNPELKLECFHGLRTPKERTHTC